MFDQRLIQPEVLDHLAPHEARPNLADLVQINRRFGGHSVLRRTLARLSARFQANSFLDIGAASGDAAQVIRSVFPAASVTSLDCNPTNLENAPAPKLLADAFHLPFSGNSFDVVTCSLFLHHFVDSQIVLLLRQFYAVARRALVVCDLERHILPYLFLAASKPVFRWNYVTVHDGLRSVRASFRKNELAGLAQAAGMQRSEIHAYRPAFRIAMLIEK